MELFGIHFRKRRICMGFEKTGMDRLKFELKEE